MAEPDVPIRRHVVHAEPIRGFLQADFVVGHERSLRHWTRVEFFAGVFSTKIHCWWTGTSTWP
jgi:hypothetical protein